MCIHHWINNGNYFCELCGKTYEAHTLDTMRNKPFNGDAIEYFFGLKDFTHNFNEYKLDLNRVVAIRGYK